MDLKDKDKDKEMVLISARVPREVENALRDFAEVRRSSRSQTAAEALEFYAHAKQCVICGEMNPGKAEHCFSCGSDLFSDDDIRSAIEGLCYDEEYDRMVSGKSLGTLDELSRKGFCTEFEPCILKRASDGKWHFAGDLYLDFEGITICAEEVDTRYEVYPERLLERLKKDRPWREDLKRRRMMEETKE